MNTLKEQLTANPFLNVFDNTSNNALRTEAGFNKLCLLEKNPSIKSRSEIFTEAYFKSNPYSIIPKYYDFRLDLDFEEDIFKNFIHTDKKLYTECLLKDMSEDGYTVIMPIYELIIIRQNVKELIKFAKHLRGMFNNNCFINKNILKLINE